jgi:hypothetical protein
MSQMAMETLTYAYKERLAFIVFSLQVFRQATHIEKNQQFCMCLSIINYRFDEVSQAIIER